MRAGVFDSGVGGLTVVKSLIKHGLFDEIIYFGDTARVPYGPKDKNTIIRYSLEAQEFFKNFDVDILITACNSVSAYAIEELRSNAHFPVIGVIEPGVLALQNRGLDPNSQILVIGTQATINSGKYQKLLQERGYNNILAKATPLFVPIVEEEIFEGPVLQAALQHYFNDLHPDAVILGCTHFPLIQDAIANYFNNEAVLIHSGEAIVEHLQKELGIKTKKSMPNLKLFASENPEKLKKIAAHWLRDAFKTNEL
ncbi:MULTISPECIES: glutamate racemase [unclassified Nitratiruptor]|uniref:glutamate racemase n=1 Tax=unclassified Nitratiruptor TaxID=2624044 RepID=UPI001915D6B8|nr:MULTISPECIES: glutamate racemase [unclassified Nitratiruptor]BCD60758.1 glutamate racemase [Nitratiruptor sp. YY08-10]BCD64690.1 glutamate racemase [Nitratiruptor sp. YY08-14]